MMMADLGADVIKVEDPRGGDYLRWMPPQKNGVSQMFAALNRGKRSITLDLKTPKGIEAFLALAEKADVVLESFRPGVMDRLGCGWKTLSELNPRLIYCAITGFGQEGPYASRAGHDINFLAVSGLLGQIVRRGEKPVIPGFQIADVAGGAYVAAGRMMAALYSREKTGAGAFLDVSMTRGAAGLMMMTSAEALGSETLPEPGTALLSGGRAFYNVYECAGGGYMALGAIEPKFWAAFCQAVGQDGWISRHLHVGEEGEQLTRDLTALFKTRTRDEWEDVFSDVDACCEPVLEMDEAPGHQAMSGADAYQFTLDAEGDNASLQFLSPVLSEERGRKLTPAPGQGEHTREVLLELGWDDERISTLS